MKKGFVIVILMASGLNVFAATEQIMWGKLQDSFSKFKAIQPGKALTDYQYSNDQNYKLKPLNPTNFNNKHIRYQLTYKDIPIWGHQIIIHNNTQEPMLTGIKITGIEQDLKTLTPKFSSQEIEQKILHNEKSLVKHSKTEKVIYIDNKKKAHLAWHFSYFTNDSQKPISSPHFLVDAHDGTILKEWNEARNEKIGQGLGGNAFPLPYRPGTFQHGDALPGLMSLGKFDVKVDNGQCVVENDRIKVINLSNSPLGYGAFPITVFDEIRYNLKAFSYPCSEESLYLNYADGTTGPINYSFSPVNDTMYFAEKTFDMFKEIYGVEEPLGNDLPVRAYTHLGEMDNAFAIPSIKLNGILIAHQQIAIGNGGFYLTAPVQSVIAHELAHNFTEINSGLFYEGQSGGINEAFSDMAAIALQDYLSKEYPWYWDGKDWSVGREAMIGGEPLRYMHDPSLDGSSIAHTKDYYDGIDTHYSSGVFNKAFYLLADKYGLGVELAFQLMVDANQYYWSPIAYFDFAACGVIQAALDRKLNPQPVIDAFREVGVGCPIEGGLAY